MATGPPDPLTVVTTSRFERDSKLARKRGLDMSKLIAVVDELRNRGPLVERHRDHALVGDWKGWRDGHVEPDWLLTYCVSGDELILGRTGTHSDIFGR